jgi:phthiocerol/phenolphthiocerol synthesis type-I polyketide synthase D
MAATLIRWRISAVMGLSGDGAIETDQPLTGLGMDSLMAVRMRNTVRACRRITGKC